MKVLPQAPIETSTPGAAIRLPILIGPGLVEASDEALRLAALERYRIFDSPPEQLYDRISRMAALACEAPVAVVAFVGQNRQWYKAAYGCETLDMPNSLALCGHAMKAGETMVVEDAADDERFSDDPLVTEQGVRFYAGVPLQSPEGYGLGALCVMDYQPRTLSPDQQMLLEDLAAVISRDLDARRAAVDFEAVFENHPVPIWIYEIETLRILAVNDYAIEAYGYTREEFLSMRLMDLRPKQDVPALLNAIGRFDGRHERTGPWRHKRADGSLIWTDVAVQGIIYQGKPAVLSISSDVTEQVTWKRAHAVTDERFKILVDAVDEYAIILLDPVGRVISWNRGACRLYGQDEAEALGKPSADLFPHEEEARQTFLQHLREGSEKGAFQGEACQLRADGSTFWADILLTPLHDENANHVGFVQITHDISLRREHEQRLIEDRERAEQIHEITSRHLIRMSREVRTPLTGIIGAAEVLGQDAVGDQAIFAESIRRNGECLLEAVGTALEYVQLQGDLEALALHEIDLVAEARAVVERYAGRAVQFDLIMALETEAETVAAIGHDDILHRVLDQIVRNAMKFTEQGEVVVRVGHDYQGPFIEVRDSGIGIEADFVRQIFEPFTQENPDYGRPLSGSGLGLAIARTQIERMDGTISATSEKGHGSVFTLRLPATEE